MRTPPETHQQLISLQLLCLDGRALTFRQAFVSVSAKDGAPLWNCTLRGVPANEVGCLQGELRLTAKTLDGRQIEGRILAAESERQPGGASGELEFEGLRPLLIDGRELWGG